MKVPRLVHQIGADLQIRPRDCDPDVVHLHVMKHPMGLGALHGRRPRTGPRRWDSEGWSKLEPPLLTVNDRRELVNRIRRLVVNDMSCRADLLDQEEVARADVDETLPCPACDARLAGRCASEVQTVAEGYLAHVDKQLQALTPAVQVDRAELVSRILEAVRKRLPLPNGVLSVGLLPNGHEAVRIHTSDGVNTEFYFRLGPRWRTTYREVPRGPNDLAAFLLALLPDAPRIPMSGFAFVARQWWGDSRS